jgi:proline dehydrogenase
MQSRASVSELATRFVGGRDVPGVLETAKQLKTKGINVSFFYLGEYVIDPEKINKTLLELNNVCSQLKKTELDIHISFDPTQAGYLISESVCTDNAFYIADAVKAASVSRQINSNDFLMIDMEDSSVTDATIRLYEKLVKQEYCAAVTLQAYLYRTKRDLSKIVNSGGRVRLVKGAMAEGKERAFTDRKLIDKNYKELAELMLSEEAKKNNFYPIFATHDENMISHILKTAKRNNWQKHQYEFEMLYGVRKELQNRLVDAGEKLRLYLPFGIDWWPYAVRRVGESSNNLKFLIRSLSGI